MGGKLQVATARWLAEHTFPQADQLACVSPPLGQARVPEYEKDIWDLATLGISLNRSQTAHKLNFTRIVQPWLRSLAKRYLQYNLSIHSTADTQGKRAAIQKFSSFLAQEAPNTQIADLDRELLLRYLSFLQGENLSEVTRIGYLLSLRVFLETCAHHFHVAGLTREPLIFYDDLPTHPEYGTREIPEEVLVQVRTHLKTLPTTVLRMVTLLLELGLYVTWNMPSSPLTFTSSTASFS